MAGAGSAVVAPGSSRGRVRASRPAAISPPRLAGNLRWRLAALAGLYAALSPIWVSTSGERDAYWALIVLGAVMAVTALFSLAMPAIVATEWLTVLFGVLLFAAPWVLTYTDRVGASWTSWVVGAIGVVLGGITLSMGDRPGRQAIQH
jgi:SPW repeat-containing protein